MKIRQTLKCLLPIVLACAYSASLYAQVSVPSTFKHITVDGSFNDWTSVPLAYTAAAGSASAIQYEDVYLANDQNNLYIRFTLYAPRADAFANSLDNIFIDTDNNAATGFATSGIGSEMLIQWGGGYQQTNGVFNVGTVNNLGWAIAGSADSMDFEIAISRGATFATGSTAVFASDTIAVLLEGDDSGYNNVAFVPAHGTGGLVYTFAPPVAEPLTNNLPLVTLAGSSWQANASGTDLGTNWLDQYYDDTQPGWSSGLGLFGYTPNPSAYPPINTALASGANTYYFRTHFQWINDSANVVFAVTNYLSDGAVYYLNGAEVNRVRMPAGAVSYATPAAATNAPAGHADFFAVDGSVLQYGDNILEVETHQAANSAADMVFGLSLTAAAQFPIMITDASQPADRLVTGGNPTTFTAAFVGSGPLTYQWLKNTAPIAGATNATYTIPAVVSGDAGSYALVISNPLSTNTTRAAVLSVSNAPVVFTDPTQPADQVVVEGQATTLAVGVAGSPPLTYQWYQNGSALAGATNATYAFSFAMPTNAGAYYVKVTNPTGSTNSRTATLTVLRDTVPATIVNIAAGGSQIVVTFSKPVDPVTAGNPTAYHLGGGINVTAATVNPNDATQVILTTGSGLNWGSLYALTVTGVKDLFGNALTSTASFTRGITIDGSFGDWVGIAPIYTGPSGSDGSADFEYIYVFDDASRYYFHVTLWHDIPPDSGQFPDFVNMYFDTDNDINTGYLAGGIGSELLVQTGFGYQEKGGGFNEGSITDLNWLSLPAAPGTDFEFSISKAATFLDSTPIFITNVLNFVFQPQTPGWVPQNQTPLLSYTNATAVAVPPLPLGGLAVQTLPAGRAAVVWNSPGALQARGSLTSGSWTNVPSATSPYVAPAAGTQLYFRLAQ